MPYDPRDAIEMLLGGIFAGLALIAVGYTAAIGLHSLVAHCLR